MLRSFREEIAEAQRTNKPSGRCHYCLIISKTCREETKSIPATGGAPKEEYMFVNAEEEFFYEVKWGGKKTCTEFKVLTKYLLYTGLLT